MTLEQIANWKSFQNPLENVLGLNSVCPAITTRVAESIGGGINASTILVSEDLMDTTDVRMGFITDKETMEIYLERKCKGKN